MTRCNSATIPALISLAGAAVALPGCTFTTFSDTRTARVMDRLFFCDGPDRGIEYEGRPIGDPARPASSGSQGSAWPRR